MDQENGSPVDDEQKFWSGLDAITTSPFDTHELIDDALRCFLAFTTQHKEYYATTEYGTARCCYKLLDSDLFLKNQQYVRRQILYCLLEEDDEVDFIYLAAAVLLFDGRSSEIVFEMMQAEGAFPRLVGLIQDNIGDGSSLPRLILELLYNMARVQRLQRHDLIVVDDNFIVLLFRHIEEVSDDAEDPYHYPIIRVLLVLNEQYMCLANLPSSPLRGAAVTNRIVKVLSLHGSNYRTFGENLILLLNRETALGSQLLILKLLYLLFTTPTTYEYFYTNDLHVLVDVIIRNLLDLDPVDERFDQPSESTEMDGQKALRHTYLRVLCPLLKNTQLSREGNNYKRDEVRRLLHLLINRSSAHFEPTDATVIRLVIRCRQIAWLRQAGDELDEEIDRKLSLVAPKENDVAQKLLGMSLQEAGESNLSVMEVTANIPREKPAVPAPRRRRNKKADGVEVSSNGPDRDDRTVLPRDMKISPALPQHKETDGASPIADDKGK